MPHDEPMSTEAQSALTVPPEGNVPPQVASRGLVSAHSRCPHLLFRDVLGEQTVGGLLNYVAAREGDFKPAAIRDRDSGENRINNEIRDSVYLNDLGPFADPIRRFITSIAAPALEALNLVEPAVEPKELEIGAYRNGGYLRAHIDTDERLHRVRVLSCVYYFAATPCRFSGGELRLYGFAKLPTGPKPEPAPHVDISPDTDTLVVFPSWLRHEVLPVHVPSGAWADGRFTINCFLYRASPLSGNARAVP
jgi:SM-20-related protein